MLLEIFIWSSWVNAILSGAMVALVLFSRPLSRVKVYWASSCFAVAGFSVSMAATVSASTRESALSCIWFINLFSIFIPTFFFHTVYHLLEFNRPIVLRAIYTLTAVLVGINFAGQLSTVQTIGPFPYYNARLWPYDLFTAHFYGLFLLQECLIWRFLRVAVDPRKRAQLKLLLVGIGVGVLGGQTTIPMIYGVNFFPIGVPLIPVYLLAVGWGMLRYQFLDFRFALRRASVSILIYAVSAVVLLPLAWPAFMHLRSLDESSSRAAITFGLLSAIYLLSGPTIYMLLIRQSGRIRTFLSAGFSHDIRSPLASIESAAEMIRSVTNEEGFDRSRVIEYIEMIERNVRQLDQFSAGMLAMMRADGGAGHIEIEVSLLAAISEIAEGLRPLMIRKNLKLDISISPSLRVRVNPHGLRSIVSNLLSNSIRHAEDSTIEISAHLDNEEIAVSVLDRGSGLSSGSQEKIFDEYFRDTEKTGGVGLGLTIARNWVESHGGRIWAESIGRGSGTKVTFTLVSSRCRRD